MAERICECCGGTFEAHNPKQMYCDDVCKRKAENMRRRMRKNSEASFLKICKACGKPFETRNYRYMYCSDECRDAVSTGEVVPQFESIPSAEVVQRVVSKKSTLVAMAVEARRKGTSYGKLMAQRMMERGL